MRGNKDVECVCGPLERIRKVIIARFKRALRFKYGNEIVGRAGKQFLDSRGAKHTVKWEGGKTTTPVFITTR